MKIIIESTDKLVQLISGESHIWARVWQGETEAGIPVQCFLVRIAPEIPESHPDIDALTAEFNRDLERTAAPRPSIEAIPLRLLIDPAGAPPAPPATPMSSSN